MKYQKLVDKINSYRDLEYNWNGYGAPKFSELVIESSLALLQELTIEPNVSPTGRNSIQFEYQLGEDYFEIEVYKYKSKIFRVVNGVETVMIISNAYVYSYANMFTSEYSKEQ